MLDSEPKVKEKAGYSTKTAAMTWQGKQPEAFKAGLAEFPENYRKNPIGALSTLSSVYYSYASHRMRNDLQGNFLRKALVKGHVILLVLKAARVSDRMVKEAGGLAFLTADQLNVRTTIMRAARRWKDAQRAACMGLGKSPAVHTEALLLIDLAEIHRHFRDEEAMLEAYECAARLIPTIEEKAERAGDYRQLARICRHLEEHYLNRDQEYDAAPMRDKKEWATRIAKNLEVTEGVR